MDTKYRLLNVGEIIQEGDEAYLYHNWYRHDGESYHIGEIVKKHFPPIRREMNETDVKFVQQPGYCVECRGCFGSCAAFDKTKCRQWAPVNTISGAL